MLPNSYTLQQHIFCIIKILHNVHNYRQNKALKRKNKYKVNVGCFRRGFCPGRGGGLSGIPTHRTLTCQPASQQATLVSQSDRQRCRNVILAPGPAAGAMTAAGDQATDSGRPARLTDAVVEQMASTGWRRLRQETVARSLAS